MDRVTAYTVLGLQPTDKLCETGIKNVIQVVKHTLDHCNTVERTVYTQQLEALNTLLEDVRSC